MWVSLDLLELGYDVICVLILAWIIEDIELAEVSSHVGQFIILGEPATLAHLDGGQHLVMLPDVVDLSDDACP